MKIQHFQDTDALYIKLCGTDIAETRGSGGNALVTWTARGIRNLVAYGFFRQAFDCGAFSRNGLGNATVAEHHDIQAALRPIYL